ncbi:MAG: hypothetical protein ACRDRK_00090 [Pseudonocardia sp.]
MGTSAGAGDSGPPRHGAYGLRLTGLVAASRFLIEVPDTWPHLTIEHVLGRAIAIEQGSLGDHRAEFRVLDQTDQPGCARIDRKPLTARFTSPGGFGDAEMIHPNLGLLAAIANRWLGRQAIHAGAFLTGGGAWAVMGAKEAGKSSTLGHLATKGLGIVTDDVLIVEDGSALAGPRCVDLRAGAADWLGHGECYDINGRRRWRVHVPAVPAAVPLQGWILPAWGDRVELEPVLLVRRLPILYANLALTKIPHHPEQLLRLASLPFLIFRRPRRWQAMDEAATILLDRLDS